MQPRVVFYKDVSRRPGFGEEFIEVTWEQKSSGFEVCIVRGKFGGRKHRWKCRRFETRTEAQRAVQSHFDQAFEAGFKRYNLSYPEAEGKPLK